MTTIPFALPENLRNEHHHICAGIGWGKTQSLQYMIARDIEAGHGVIVIDGQGDLIKNISRLRSVRDKLVLVDPDGDFDYPISLGMFSFGQERIAHYSKVDQQALLSSTLELMDFVMASLLGAALTSKQSTAFRFVVRAMMQIPDATLLTLFHFLRDHAPYQKYIDRLTGVTRMFFDDPNGYSGKEFKDTRSQVVRRLYGILENETFLRLFSSPVSKVDIFKLLNEGKCLLVSTDMRLLKTEGSQILGRFFIAMVLQAANERAIIPREKRKRAYLYIDEAAQYIDHNVALLLETARKYEVGVILAHQYLQQLSAPLQAALSAVTSIKMVGGVSAEDARKLAPQLQCEPAFIERQPKGSFATFLKGQGTLSLKFRFGYMESLPQLTQAEYDAMRERIRAEYCAPYQEPAPAAPSSPEPEPATPDPPDLPKKSTTF